MVTIQLGKCRRTAPMRVLVLLLCFRTRQVPVRPPSKLGVLGLVVTVPPSKFLVRPVVLGARRCSSRADCPSYRIIGPSRLQVILARTLKSTRPTAR